MLWAILNKFCKQHPTKQRLYGQLPPISKTIQISWTRHAGHDWRSKDELISEVLPLNPSHGLESVGRTTRTYLLKLCMDTVCSLEGLQEAMDDRDEWRERIREIHASCLTWWWWLFVQFLRIKNNWNHINPCKLNTKIELFLLLLLLLLLLLIEINSKSIYYWIY